MAALQLAATQDVTPWSTIEGEARVDLATCHLGGERLDAAQETPAALWSIPPEWRRTGLLGRLDRVQELLSTEQWRRVPEARQLAELATSFAAARPAPPALPAVQGHQSKTAGIDWTRASVGRDARAGGQRGDLVVPQPVARRNRPTSNNPK